MIQREPTGGLSRRTPAILLTGATGYVGGRLLPLLENRSSPLRCLARDPERLRPRVAASTQLVRGDVRDATALAAAVTGITTAYYLIHSMGSAGKFEVEDRASAEQFVQAAEKAGVQRIIYLGGLGVDDGQLSPHLRSRQEVGRILRSTRVECIEFRSSIVIGAGSLSFDLVRSLTNRLPVMICPRWLATPTQPIAVDDLLAYLLAALELPPGPSRVYEIGGTDVVTYGDIIREYARQQGLRRWLISVPFLTPYLSSLWLGLVTPATATVGRHLVESLRNPTVVHDHSARKVFPIQPIGIAEAVRRALAE